SSQWTRKPDSLVFTFASLATHAARSNGAGSPRLARCRGRHVAHAQSPALSRISVRASVTCGCAAPIDALDAGEAVVAVAPTSANAAVVSASSLAAASLAAGAALAFGLEAFAD